MNELSNIARGERPVVRVRENRLAPAIFVILIAMGGIWLFLSLESARESRSAGAESKVELGTGRPLPELALPVYAAAGPQAYANPAYSVRPSARLAVVSPAPAVRPSAAIAPRTSYNPPAPAYQPQYLPVAPPPPPSAPLNEYRQPEGGLTAERASNSAPAAGAQRIAAPAFTVVEGTMIPAVLETALDSTRPGPVRAVVSRDVRAFDGSNILVPRGSRLIGEYEATLSPGQDRAVVNWTRLIRPDGVTIGLKSPGTDALGRVGVRGKVNNHTFRRLTDTLMQTVVNAGSGFSQRAAPVVVMPPGGAQTQPIMLSHGSTIQPTLTVAQGARVNVFVAQDLDFSSVDQAQ